MDSRAANIRGRLQREDQRGTSGRDAGKRGMRQEMDRGLLRFHDDRTEGACRFEEPLVRRENLRSGVREVRVNPHCDAF